MSLVLLCGSLEPGADGVGDYSRQLAVAFTRLGVETQLLALHDPHVSSPQLARQSCAGASLATYRLPSALPWPQRARLVEEQLQAWRCSAISLQFVPYAYSRQGLPLGLLALLRRLTRHLDLQVHLMVHEIWIGIRMGSDPRSRLIGHLQRRLLQAIHATTRPVLVHVTNATYACCLRRAGIQASRLNLFTNLDPSDDPTPSPTEPGQPPSDQPHTYSACIFGRIPPQWDPDPALQVLVAEAARHQLAPRLLLLGRHWASSAWFAALRQRWPQVQIVEHGVEASPARLCRQIRGCNLGLATVPWALVEKSSAVATFVSLGVPVLVSRDDWRLRRRWRGNDNPDLPDHNNLFRLSAWRAGRHAQPLPTYIANTPAQVASAMMAGLRLDQTRACSS
jgi:hypothetical protein